MRNMARATKSVDFYDPDDRKSAVLQDRRRIFFGRLSRTVPDVLRELRETIYPKYRELYVAEFKGRSKSPRAGDEAGECMTRFGGSLLPMIKAWSCKHHLNGSEDDWVEAQVMFLFWRWVKTGVKRYADPPALPASSQVWIRSPDFEFHCLGWGVNLQTWKDFERRATRAFRKQLAAHREQGARLATRKGLRSLTNKRAVSSNERYVHYDWTALRICECRSFAHIARKYNPNLRGRLSEDGVRKAVNATAKHLGLALPFRPETSARFPLTSPSGA